MQLPNRKLTSAIDPGRAPRAMAARSPKGAGRPTPKPAAPKAGAKPAPKPTKPAPAAKPAKPAPAARPARASKAAQKPAAKAPPRPPERLALRQMGRGRRPANLPELPALPPPPPSAPEFQGAAPTMHYGEAPVPPKKKGKSNAPRSTAARAAEAARAAVWAVSSPKTTAQIEAAETAFEEALTEHHAQDAQPAAEAEAPAATETKPAPRRTQSAPRDRWDYFREEISREDEPGDPHTAWRAEHGRPRHEMFRPATEEQLVEVETQLKVSLPPSYRDFSLHWGGGRLYTQEWREVRLVGARDLPVEVHDRLCDRMHSPWLPLVDLGQGDYLAFDTSKPNAKGEYPIHWWYGGEAKKKVATSFSEWLEKFVAEGGEAFWWEEPS